VRRLVRTRSRRARAWGASLAPPCTCAVFSDMRPTECRNCLS
jgi:hypothetical protein